MAVIRLPEYAFSAEVRLNFNIIVLLATITQLFVARECLVQGIKDEAACFKV